MQGGQFPASAANSLIQGYCEDFVSFAAVLAQTLEQVSMRGIDLKQSRPELERIENGMRNLADAIHELLTRQPATGGAEPTKAASAKAQPSAAPPVAPKAKAPNTQPESAPKAPTVPAPSVKPAAPAKQDTVRVDMRPRDEEPTRPPTTTPDKAGNAGPKPAPSPATTPTTKVDTTTPSATPLPPPAAVASTPSRAIGNAPANRAKAAAPGSTPRPAASSNAARPGQRTAARPENLKGTNRSMPLLSVMQFLGRMRKRGTMTVVLPNEELTFDIENGCVMSAASSNCPNEERLGDLLCDMDVCTRDQLEPLELLVKSGLAAERFGQLVLEHQLATDQQVVAALEAQVKTRFGRACKHLEASYEFVEGERTSAPPVFHVQPMPIG